MKYQPHYLALVFKENPPQIICLGLEFGGRSRRHLDKNLLKPGFGGGDSSVFWDRFTRT